MTQPAVWDGDPNCGHGVANSYQTHYCSYIRVPRLLTLQPARNADDLWLVTVYQWHELWFKVLLTDLRAAFGQNPRTFGPVKLLRRGIELFQLFQQCDMLATGIVERQLALTSPRLSAESATGALPLSTADLSDQFSQLNTLVRRLPRLARAGDAALADVAREYRARFKPFREWFQGFARRTLRASGEERQATRYIGNRVDTDTDEGGREPRDEAAMSYSQWLCLPQLLDLQNGVKAGWAEEGAEPSGFYEPETISPDENLFVIVHQCFELWFKVLLSEIDQAIPELMRDDVAGATRRLERVTAVQRLLVSQIQIPATMMPLDFLAFRHQSRVSGGKEYKTGLSPASGTESYQFREIEIVSGLRDDAVYRRYLEGVEQLPTRLLTPKQKKRLEEPTIGEAFRQAVERRGIESLDSIFQSSTVENPNADLALLADVLLQFDEFFRLWRLNHVSMVEKMIGARSGTGGLGPEYLMETAGIKLQEQNRVLAERQIRPRFFEELWAIRTRLNSQGGM